MTTRGQINSNFYQIVNVDSDGNPTEVKSEYITGGNVDHANVADVANSVSVGNVVGLGNIATINLNNSSSNVLYGNGVWANLPPQANANYANFAGNSFGVNAAVANVFITGGVNGYVLQTDGAGNLTWTAQTGGGGNASPGGANTQVQYNNSGVFAGSANFTFNNTTNTLTVTNIAGDGYGISNINIANIPSLGNIATINLDGNVSNILHGDGSWGPESETGNANYAAYAGNVTIAAQPNITSVGNLINLQFDTTVTPITANAGQMFWDTTERTVTLGMLNGVQQQIGLEQYVLVKASSTITNGQVVMFTGADGNNITAAPADASSVGFKTEYIIGIATEDIATNGFGYITTFGQVHGLNTNAYNVGDILWYDPTSTTGGLTATQPTDPNYQVQMCAVTKKSGGDGHVQVRITVFNPITRLSDVQITTPITGQTLVYNGSNVWINGNSAYANTAGTVTTAAQPNITSTGTLISLVVTGNISGGNISTTGLANLSNVQLKIFEETVLASANTSTSISPDVTTGSIFRYTANANFTFNGFTNGVAGSSATVVITQDATGNRLLTSTMKFAGASKTLSTAANAIDIISVFYDGTTYYATLSKGYA